jgi:TgpA N-terminal domain
VILSAPPQHRLSLLWLECGLTAVAVLLSISFPRLGAAGFARFERVLAQLARRKGLAVLVVGLSALLRLAVLPVFPAPRPFLPDDFSFLLAADTFAAGHLTNPTPAMWTHFESIHITMQPTYTSMYFPGSGLVLAVGQVLFHNPWLTNVCVNALMCAALCWMLQSWIPPNWALLGGFLAVLRIGLFSYWINTFYGGSALPAALGGALVLGALPRMKKTARLRYGMLLSLGIAILALTRPYEGVLLCVPVAVVLIHWARRGTNRPKPIVLLRRAALPLALLLATLCWFGYYNYRSFGSPTTLPYTVDRAQYGIVPYFIWQPLRPEPHYRYDVIAHYYEHEVGYYQKVHSIRGYLPATLDKAVGVIVFYAGFALLLPLIMARRVLLDRRVRFLVLCVAAFVASMSIEIFTFPHYLSPFLAALYALGLQAMRHLRVWKLKGSPVGRTFVRLSIANCLLLSVASVFASPLHLKVPEWPRVRWDSAWQSTADEGIARARIADDLEQLLGPQLAIVRYTPGHNPLDEWVFNRADIDASKVVWAREGDAAANSELLRYYHARQAWLIEPDTVPATVIPYPALSPAASPPPPAPLH